MPAHGLVLGVETSAVAGESGQRDVREGEEGEGREGEEAGAAKVRHGAIFPGGPPRDPPECEEADADAHL